MPLGSPTSSASSSPTTDPLNDSANEDASTSALKKLFGRNPIKPIEKNRSFTETKCKDALNEENHEREKTIPNIIWPGMKIMMNKNYFKNYIKQQQNLVIFVDSVTNILLILLL